MKAHYFTNLSPSQELTRSFVLSAPGDEAPQRGVAGQSALPPPGPGPDERHPAHHHQRQPHGRRRGRHGAR